MGGRDNTWADMATAAAFAVILGISTFWGQSDRAYDWARGRTGSAYSRMYEQTDPEGENENLVGKAGAYLDTMGAVQTAEGPGENPARSGGGDAGILPGVTKSQRVVLDEIMEALEAQDLESVVRIVDRSEEELLTLFCEVIDGMQYLYDGQSSSLSIESKGPVFIMPKILYYSASRASRSEGDRTALQVVEPDALRYGYSQGLWRDGKMEGDGHTEYCYYGNSPWGGARDVCETGGFSDDGLEGEVTYTILNQEGETSTWKLEVKDSMVQLDGRWIHIEECGEYQLMPQEDDSHAYIMDEKLVGQPV